MNLISLGVLIAITGGIGALIRLALGFWSGKIPWGILVANSLGSFIAGLALGFGPGYEFLIVGLAGSLSTFSTFAAQSFDLITKGRVLAALQNIALNLLMPSALFLTGTLVT